MAVFTGAKGVQIFDIDRERWIWSGTQPQHQNEHITNIAEAKSDTSSEGGNGIQGYLQWG